MWIHWFQVVVGLAIVGLWAMLLTTRKVPEIAAGDREIWFHLAAELVTASLLLASGISALVSDTGATRQLSAVALGALLYTTIASPGYYVARNEWPPVIMFTALVVATVAAIIVLVVS